MFLSLRRKTRFLDKAFAKYSGRAENLSILILPQEDSCKGVQYFTEIFQESVSSIHHMHYLFYRFFFSVILFFCLIGTITEIYLGLLNPSAEHISTEIALDNVDLKHGHIDTGTDKDYLHDSTKAKDNKEGNMTFTCLFVFFSHSLLFPYSLIYII